MAGRAKQYVSLKICNCFYPQLCCIFVLQVTTLLYRLLHLDPLIQLQSEETFTVSLDIHSIYIYMRDIEIYTVNKDFAKSHPRHSI